MAAPMNRPMSWLVMSLSEASARREPSKANASEPEGSARRSADRGAGPLSTARQQAGDAGAESTLASGVTSRPGGPARDSADGSTDALGRVPAPRKEAGARGESPEEPDDGEDIGDEEFADEPEPRQGLTPREARRVRAITAAVFMVCIAVGLLVQLSGQTSLMTLALYGIGMVLSGIAIKLSYAGRTRVAMAVIVLGFGLVVAEQLLRRL